MRLLSRAIFREIATGTAAGVGLFSLVFFLQQLGSGQVFALLLRSDAEPRTIAYLLGLLIPPTLPFTVPVGVLVGILIALSRMSSDNEVIAMRAAGVPARVIFRPVLLFAAIGLLTAASASLWLTPWSIRELIRVSNQLAATQLTAQIQPRVFEESFPNTILYVGDVIAGPVVRWRNVFMADLRPPEQRRSGAREPGEAPPVTIASDAVALVDSQRNRIQLSMRNGFAHEVGKSSADDYNTAFPRGDQVLEAQKPPETRARRAFSEIDTVPLYRLTQTLKGKESIDARIELHQRLALPWACVLLSLIGVPLGVSTRKAGKSWAFVLTVLIAILYFTGMVGLIGLAREGAIPVAPAVWTPSAVFAITGIILAARLERSGDFDIVAYLRGFVDRLSQRFRGLPQAPSVRFGRLWAFPSITDTYVLTSFAFYFSLLLASFVLMFEIYTFFELLSDIVKNKVPMSRVLTYMFFLAPKLVYDFAPLGVLAASLVTFGVMTKSNEVTALKACGVSVYRLALPVLIAAVGLSFALFAFDQYYIPQANRKQDALRNEIKGKPVQSYLRPDRRWIYGQGSRMFYYRFFDSTENVMIGVSVYELDRQSFRLRRLISAERARWEPSLKTWVFQNGQKRDIEGTRVTGYTDFSGQTATFPEIDEPPGYFRQEVRLSQQMNFAELGNYIRELAQSGVDTIKLQVQRQAKLSAPVFALIMAMMSIPFAFFGGNRGAMAGAGASLGVAIAYVAITKLFEQVGFLNQLPAALAAWAPVAIFALAGLYLMSRVRT